MRVTLTLRPCWFIEAEADTLLMQRLADKVPSSGWYMGVMLAEDLETHVSTTYMYSRRIIL